MIEKIKAALGGNKGYVHLYFFQCPTCGKKIVNIHEGVQENQVDQHVQKHKNKGEWSDDHE